MSDHRFIQVGDDDGAEVHIAGIANVSGFQTELDLGGIFMQIIRTFGQLSYCDRELAFDVIVCGVFNIEFTRRGDEANQGIVFVGFEDRIQIKGVFPVGIPSMYNGAIVGVLLDWSFDTISSKSF